MDAKKLLLKLIENWPAKVLSIALALTLFVFHRMGSTAIRPLSVPLIVETSAALVPASDFPQNVRVQLRGEDDRIRTIAENDIEAFVDFRAQNTEGLYRAPVQIRKRGSALGVEPLEISVNPMEVSVQLDLRISRTIPLTPDIRGRVASGFDLVSHAISPVEIDLSGPANALDGISEIRTEPIDLEGRAGDFSIEINIARPNPLIEIKGSGLAEFKGTIRPSVAVRNIDNIPISAIALAPGLAIDLGGKTGSIRFGGSQALLDNFTVPPDFFSVDCSQVLEPGTYTLPVEVALPDTFLLIRREPQELKVAISAILIEDGSAECDQQEIPQEE